MEAATQTGTPLDADLCYQAIASRDGRFDGRFFTAVTTTGIYCRPICPARTPLKRNVTFYPCAAAAEEAGFRPCRRCRPDTCPGTPEWGGTSATVSRALRLIDDGALDQGSVTLLSTRLGIGERHLARLFSGHLGASPLAIAQTRRAHFARKLLEETGLTMTQVARASGFGSIRRFNTAIKDRFGATPTEVRKRLRAVPVPGAAGRLTLRLPYRAPLAWGALLGFLGPRCTPGVESVQGNAYRRTFADGGDSGVLEVRPAADALVLDVPVSLTGALLRLTERARNVFDLRADPQIVMQHLQRDALLARRTRRRPGLRVPGAWSGFEVAVRAILGQQVSVKGATTLAGRLADRYGEPVAAPENDMHRLFPEPEVLARARLGGLGLTGARRVAIQRLARAVCAGEIELDSSADVEETCGKLLSLPGIGPWTVSYIAMRALRHPDAFPDGDLGLRKAVSGKGALMPARRLSQRAETWRPWRSYAAMYLWDRED